MTAEIWRARAEWSGRVRRWPVFLVRGFTDPDNPKAPLPGLHWPSAATTDPKAIKRWPDRYTAYGIACKRAGLVVIDLDVAKDGSGATGEAAFRALCADYGERWPIPTYTVATPSDGKHLVFRADPERPVGCADSMLPPLINVKGGRGNDGGYVVGAGSVIPAGEYRVVGSVLALASLPDWLAHLLTRPPRTEATPQATLTPRLPDRYAQAALEAEAAIVAATAKPGRNNQLNVSAWNLARFPERDLPAGVILAVLGDAARQAGLPDTRIGPTIRSALRARRTEA
jgi:hypothetical protein